MQEIYAELDPVVLLRNIRAAQESLAALADRKFASDASAAPQLIELYLASLRTAWKDGRTRPTDKPVMKAKRGGRRPDALIRVTVELRAWYEAEPWRTGSELLSQTAGRISELYSDKLLRTLQRRLKSWRSEQANALLFASAQDSTN